MDDFQRTASALAWIECAGKRKYGEGDAQFTLAELLDMTLPQAHTALQKIKRDDALLRGNFWAALATKTLPASIPIMRELHPGGEMEKWRDVFMTMLRWLSHVRITLEASWQAAIERRPECEQTLKKQRPGRLVIRERVDISFEATKLSKILKTATKRSETPQLTFKEGRGDEGLACFAALPAAAAVLYGGDELVSLEIPANDSASILRDVVTFAWSVDKGVEAISARTQLRGKLDAKFDWQRLGVEWYRDMLRLTGATPQSAVVTSAPFPETTRQQRRLGADAVDFRNVEKETEDNTKYRNVVYTTPDSQMQLVLMSLKPGDTIPFEVHTDVAQFVRVESGRGECRVRSAFIDPTNNEAVKESRVYKLRAGSSVLIPAGVEHEFRNTSATLDLKLYSVYAPAEHAPGLVQNTQPR